MHYRNHFTFKDFSISMKKSYSKQKTEQHSMSSKSFGFYGGPSGTLSRGKAAWRKGETVHWTVSLSLASLAPFSGSSP